MLISHERITQNRKAANVWLQSTTDLLLMQSLSLSLDKGSLEEV
jgi:hypothetical protein